MDPNLLFFSGILSIVPFLLLRSIWLKLGLLLFYYILSRFNSKRIRLPYFIVLSAFIIFFELMIPAGKILLQIGPFKLTEFALHRGILKAATLVGLVFISLSTIRKDIRIPGGAGILFGKTFFYFEQLLQSKNRVKAKKFISSIDDILYGIFPPDGAPAAPGPEKPKTSGHITVRSVLAAIGLTAVPWLCLLAEKLYF